MSIVGLSVEIENTFSVATRDWEAGLGELEVSANECGILLEDRKIF